MQLLQKQNLNSKFFGFEFLDGGLWPPFLLMGKPDHPINNIFLFSCYARSTPRPKPTSRQSVRRIDLFTFDPIDRREYRFVMIVAAGLLVVITTNFQKFMDVLTGSINCTGINSLCISLAGKFPDYVVVTAITLFLITTALATIRRVKATPISNYWVVILSVLIFLDYQYLTGLNVVWSANFSASLHQLPIPWYLLSAASLVFLLSFASANSAYFLDGYWNADPPLGYGLSISSFWLLAFSSSKILLIVGTATGNPTLWHSGNALQSQMSSLLPPLLISPAIPAVIFITCSILLAVLGRLKQENKEKTAMVSLQDMHRRQTALRTTRAAQSANGLKL